ncbi:MAG: response regulator transcription factor [Saprospiraceae bacterium]|nr:response regulator transcription factor [Saprospiraceae bacterium]
MIKVLIADDHPIYRKGLVNVIQEEADMEIVADVGNGKDVLDLIPEKSPQVVVLDIMMPGLTGLQVAQEMKKRSLDSKIIILTAYKEETVFNEALDAGAMGFVLKDNATKDIISSIKMVAEGMMYISPALSEYLINKSNKPRSKKVDLKGLLTETELRILGLVSNDFTSKQIAKKLFVSLSTVESHRANICKKLEIKGKNCLLKFVLLNSELIAEILEI